ncbi:Galactosylceramide sulfotransferase [Armadillidium nasatum]|uniref:Galactosylceramide sulfotransferase n=1 Tax=Armadillidium nasatum TaxID=96803 RepID=A0A5N5SK25_9CRUS|nr:Galactosylceramide sulfotransferase [Armadillidium nasatum]
MYGAKLEDFSQFPLEVLARVKRKGSRFGKNQMLFDFGLDENISISDLREKIEEIDRIFDLIIIAERMEESLVLLRHKLCWSLEDVVVFTKNARRKKGKLSFETRKRILALNSADAVHV